MRFVARSLGLFLLAAAFVGVIIDGTRSIADNQWVVVSIRAVWLWLNAASLAHAQAWVEATLSSFVWSNIAAPLVDLPFAALLLVVSMFCFFLGRKPRSRIGYVSHV